MTPKSAVWTNFKRSADGKTVKCQLCEIELTFCGGTTNLHNHLRSRHPSDSQTDATSQLSVSGFMNSPRKLNPKSCEEITKAITEMIVKDYLPISLVERDGFKMSFNVTMYKV